MAGWLGTWWAGGYFFENFMATPQQSNFTLLSAGTMPILNVALGLKVASALFLVFTVLTGLRIAADRIDDEANSGTGSGGEFEEDKS